MARTEYELAVHVLRDLGVVDATETPAADDANVLYVIDQYEDLFEKLASPGFDLVYWNPDEIPGAVFEIVADLVVNKVQGAFGQPQQPAEKMAQERIILTELRRHLSKDPSGLPTKAEYF